MPTKPENSGIPTKLKLPAVKAAMVIGIFLPMPANSLIRSLPVAAMIAPAARNRLALLTA